MAGRTKPIQHITIQALSQSEKSGNMKFARAATLALAAALCAGTQAHGVKCGDLSVEHPYSVPSLGENKTGAVYFKAIKNTGKEVDQLIGARTAVSDTVELHQMTLDNDIMKMRALSAIELPAASEVHFRHGQTSGYHLMLINLKKPLKEGDRFPIMLKFKRSGECEADVWVEAAKAPEHLH